MSAPIRQSLLFTSVALAFLACVIGLLVFLRPDIHEFKNKYSTHFQELTGCRLEVGSISPDGLLLPKIRMSDIRVFNAQGNEAAHLRWANLDLSVSDLLIGKFGIIGLDIVSPVINGHAFYQCLNAVQLAEDQPPQNQIIQNIPIEMSDLEFYSWERPIIDDPFEDTNIKNQSQPNFLPTSFQKITSPKITGHWDGRYTLSLKSDQAKLKNSPLSKLDFELRYDENGISKLRYFMRKTAQTTIKPAEFSLTYRVQNERGIITSHDLIDFLAPQPVEHPSTKNQTPENNGVLSIEAPFVIDGDLINFESITGTLGAESFTATADWTSPTETSSTARLSLKTQFGILDQKFIKNLFELSKQNHNEEEAREHSLLKNLADLPFELDFGLNATGFSDENGQISRAPIMHMIAGQGSITLDQFNISLPGGTELSILADYVPGDIGKQNWFASGGVSLQSLDFRNALRWLGFDIQHIAPGSLNNLRLSTNFDFDGPNIYLPLITGKIDVSDFKGSANLQFNDQAQLKKIDADISSNYLDLDRFNHPDLNLLNLFSSFAHFGQPQSDLSDITNQQNYFATAKQTETQINLKLDQIQYKDIFVDNVAVKINNTPQNRNIEIAGTDHETGSRLYLTSETTPNNQSNNENLREKTLNIAARLENPQPFFTEILQNKSFAAQIFPIEDFNSTEENTPAELNFSLTGPVSKPDLTIQGTAFDNHFEAKGPIHIDYQALLENKNIQIPILQNLDISSFLKPSNDNEEALADTPPHSSLEIPTMPYDLAEISDLPDRSQENTKKTNKTALVWTISQGYFRPISALENPDVNAINNSKSLRHPIKFDMIKGQIGYPGPASLLTSDLLFEDKENFARLHLNFPANLPDAISTPQDQTDPTAPNGEAPPQVQSIYRKIGQAHFENWCFDHKIQSIFPLFENSYCITGDLDVKFAQYDNGETPPNSNNSSFYEITGGILGSLQLKPSQLDSIKLPSGMLSHLKRNLETHLLDGNLSYAGYIHLTPEQIKLDNLRIDGNSIFGDVILTRHFKRQNINALLTIMERDQKNKTALSVKLAGPVSAPNLRIKGHWTQP